jgi:hypothetical protein
MAVMSDDSTDTITVVDRLLAAGLSLERAEEHLRSGRDVLAGRMRLVLGADDLVLGPGEGC